MRLLTIGLAAALLAGPAMAQTAAPAPATAAPGAAAPATTAKPKAASAREKFEARFDAANTTHDGKLTLEQAKAGKMGALVKQFAAIDATKKGYVTKDEVEAYRKAHPKEAKSL